MKQETNNTIQRVEKSIEEGIFQKIFDTFFDGAPDIEELRANNVTRWIANESDKTGKDPRIIVAERIATVKYWTSLFSSKDDGSAEGITTTIRHYEQMIEQLVTQVEAEKEQYDGKSLAEIMRSGDVKEDVPKEVYDQFAGRVFDALKKIEEDKPDIMQLEDFARFAKAIPARPPKKVKWAVDPVNKTAWISYLLEREQKSESGQIMFKTTPAEEEGGTPGITLFSLNFDAIDTLPDGDKMKKYLTSIDKRVFFAYCTLVLRGDRILTPRMIYRAMGGTGTASGTHVKNILRTLSKLRWTKMYLDNIYEVKAGAKYPRVKYDDTMISFGHFDLDEPVTINGGQTKNIIVPKGLPPLMEFAIMRDQITEIPIEMLQIPLNLNEGNAEIEDFLIRRICWMRNNKNTSRKILFGTLLKDCNRNSHRQTVKRTVEKVFICLNHFATIGAIKDFDMDGYTHDITIKLNREPRAVKEKNQGAIPAK